MIEIKNNNDSIKGNHVMLFTTPHCNPCKNMKLILQELEKNHSDKIDFYFVDTTQNEKLAEQYKIKSVPTTIFKNDKAIKDRFAGFIETVDLENKLMNLLFDFDSENEEFIDFNF
jgi:thioredoxin 1